MEITNKNKCTGCALCSYICPTNAIKMEISINGSFWYPVIDDNKCIKCKKCIINCPSNKEVELSIQKTNYVAQINREKELKASTSGGLATAISMQFVYNGGIVYGAAFNENMEVQHIRCDNVEKCKKIQGSKYIQSDISKIYESVEKDLKKDMAVLFIGTPCQCAAMKKKFNNANFYCCDFLCNGVGSPNVFKKHIQYLEKKFKCYIKDYIFRPKTSNYLEPYECFIDSNNTSYKVKSPWNKWGAIYYAGLAMRPACIECLYTNKDRIGDITFSDIPLNIDEKIIGRLPYDLKKYGASLISVNSSKGSYLIKLANNIISFEETSIGIVDNNKHLSHSMKNSRDFCDMAMLSLEKAKINFIGRKTKYKSYIIEFLKR